MIAHRYEQGTTIITSNVSIREWPKMLAGEGALTTAILDRLLHHRHMMQIDGSSHRLRDPERRLAGNPGGAQYLTNRDPVAPSCPPAVLSPAQKEMNSP